MKHEGYTEPIFHTRQGKAGKIHPDDLAGSDKIQIINWINCL